MAAQKGKDLLLKIYNGSTYTTVAGLRARAIVMNAETVDITPAESAGQWRELLDGGGVKRASLSGAGVFKDGSSDSLLRTAFFAGDVLSWQIVVPDFGTLQGDFQITSLEYRGDHTGEVTFDLAVESAGEITFTAA